MCNTILSKACSDKKILLSKQSDVIELYKMNKYINLNTVLVKGMPNIKQIIKQTFLECGKITIRPHAPLMVREVLDRLFI